MNIKLFASVAVIALTMCALGGVAFSEESDAVTDLGTYTSGPSQSSTTNLYSGVNSDAYTLEGKTLHVMVGSTVTIVASGDFDITAVTSGYGLTRSGSSSVSGTISAEGTITITLFLVPDEFETSITIIAVEVEDADESDIDFTSPDAVEGISGGSINYTAQTNIDATFSEAGGTGVSWLNVNSSTGLVSGTFPSVTSMTSYTYIIKATSSTNSSNTATQTITINVYPVAQISATTTSISGTEGDAISSVSLSGNLDMTFSRISGSLPSGISLSSSGTISGTPTEAGSFTVVVRGTTTEGPTQTPTITIKFSIESAEDTLSFSVADPADSYKVGESISLALSSNVSGTTYSVSGTASSFLSVSGSSIVGSVPSSYTDVTELSLTVSAETPKGQTASETISFSVEPVLAFTTVPTAECVITPVYSYDEDGTPILSSNASLLTEVWASDADFEFTDTLTILATFTGTNADTVTWYWGDGSSDVGNKVQHTYSEPGTYTITLVASNDLGDDTIEITVHVGTEETSILYYVVIGVLVLIVIYLVYRLVRSGRNVPVGGANRNVRRR